MDIKTLLSAAALVCAALPAAAAKTAAPDYWPMKVGNTWTIAVDYDGKTTPQVLTVVKSTPVAGHATEASIDYAVDGATSQTEVYRADKRGLFRVHSGKDAAGTITPPLPVIRYPVVFGSSWTWTGTFTNGDTKTKAEATLSENGPETVITSTGNFMAMRVHLELTIFAEDGEKGFVTNDYWFAPGVGMVKQAFEQGDKKVSGTMSAYSLVK